MFKEKKRKTKFFYQEIERGGGRKREERGWMRRE
jgi:hypothetical protein